jgi:predicted dehydrogenase
MGLRLSDDIDEKMYNYGQFQVIFEDGSVGWYEAGWGPMMSEVAYFVKDVISPKGAVSILSGMHPESDSVEGHTKVGALRIHRAGGADTDITFPGEPGHQDLCDAEQAYLLTAIAEDIDLSRHMEDAVQSLAICLAADTSIRTGRAIDLKG